MMYLDRRTLLAALASLAAISGSTNIRAATPATFGVDPDAAGEIGRAWLVQHPADAAALRADLFPSGTEGEALAALAKRVRADFGKDAIFVHKGWFLSATEARLCALIALG